MGRPDVIELIRGIVASIPDGLELQFPDGDEAYVSVACPQLNYVFGSAQYIKDTLDTLGRTVPTTEMKFPLVGLFTPFREVHDSPDYYARVNLRMVIACQSRKEWDNEKRKVSSFGNILRPICERLIGGILADTLHFDTGYESFVGYELSENYDYGRYGAYTDTGEEVSEPIDAINIRSLQLIIKNQNCRIK